MDRLDAEKWRRNKKTENICIHVQTPVAAEHNKLFLLQML